MPRPSWDKLPSDPAKHSEYIDKLLQSSECQNVRKLLVEQDKKRELRFRSENYRMDVNLSSSIAKTSAAIQLRGFIADEPCSSCQQGKGPFEGCVCLAGEALGRCANCIYQRRPCSHDFGKLHGLCRDTLI
jgi:hypothetical protein